MKSNYQQRQELQLKKRRMQPQSRRFQDEEDKWEDNTDGLDYPTILPPNDITQSELEIGQLKKLQKRLSELQQNVHKLEQSSSHDITQSELEIGQLKKLQKRLSELQQNVHKLEQSSSHEPSYLSGDIIQSNRPVTSDDDNCSIIYVQSLPKKKEDQDPRMELESQAQLFSHLMSSVYSSASLPSNSSSPYVYEKDLLSTLLVTEVELSISHVLQLTKELKTIYKQQPRQVDLLHLLQLLNKCVELQQYLKLILSSTDHQLKRQLHTEYKKRIQPVINEVISFLHDIFPCLKEKYDHDIDRDPLSSHVIKTIGKHRMTLVNLRDYLNMILHQRSYMIGV